MIKKGTKHRVDSRLSDAALIEHNFVGIQTVDPELKARFCLNKLKLKKRKKMIDRFLKVRLMKIPFNICI